MEKILLDYDRNSMNLYDANGNVFYSGFNNLGGFEQEKKEDPKVPQPNNVSEIVNLKTNGFTAQEIIEMKQGGIL